MMTLHYLTSYASPAQKALNETALRQFEFSYFSAHIQNPIEIAGDPMKTIAFGSVTSQWLQLDRRKLQIYKSYECSNFDLFTILFESFFLFYPSSV